MTVEQDLKAHSAKARIRILMMSDEIVGAGFLDGPVLMASREQISSPPTHVVAQEDYRYP
jgi:hypothetical protein